MRNRTALLCAAIFAATTPAHAALCTIDSAPAASVLLPYFEADVNCGALSGVADTRITVYNPGRAPRLAHVTLWTNAAVPAYNFDVYLNGFDQQDFSMRALLCNGTLPQTGTGLGNPGRQADNEVNFTGCNTSSAPGNSPVYAPIDSATLAHLRAYFSGQQSALNNDCASIADTPGTASGYVTIDAVTQCNAPVAGQPGFAAALDDTNAIAARAELFDSNNNYSVHYAGVPLEAASGTELDASATFYNLPGAAGDRREPLPSTYGVDVSAAAPFDGTDLLVWRSVGSVGTPFACNAAPAWYPLGFANRTGFGSQGVFSVDDAGQPLAFRSNTLAPLATQRISLDEPGHTPASANGWVYLNLQHAADAQAWVARVHRAEGRYATLEAGTPLDSGCDGTPFNNTSPGSPAPLP